MPEVDKWSRGTPQDLTAAPRARRRRSANADAPEPQVTSPRGSARAGASATARPAGPEVGEHHERFAGRAQ
eukprot:6374400-Alexandrium_andersonii.AAC.1